MQYPPDEGGGAFSSYVLLTQEDAAESLAHLVDDYIEGVGVRAVAHAVGEGDFTHILSINANTQEELDQLNSQMTMSARSSSTPLNVCTSPLCDGLLAKVDGKPSWIPPFEVMVFLYIELEVSIHEDGPFELPDFRSEVSAGVFDSSGKSVLIELGANDESRINADVETLGALPNVTGVRVLRTTGERIVRAEP